MNQLTPSGQPPCEFSHRTRRRAIERLKKETFDILVIGGGITGAAVARDAGSRGLKVALVERRDFAFGTSSRSSKLIHGGLRYLENFEFGLVFEALSERAFLLRSAPNMVRPLPFYLPVYEGDSHGKNILSIGLWFYDLLAAFRAPGFHKRLSKKTLLRDIPFLKHEGLQGGFSYYDASMWDDQLAVETLRAAQLHNTAIASYVEAVSPIWNDQKAVAGFKMRDLDPSSAAGEFEVRAHRVIACAGPWTDELGQRLTPDWHPWLAPSKGVHLVFDRARIPVPGAMVMSHPEDGRISFVIPRPDFGNGVTIVGTTDGPVTGSTERPGIEQADVDYLMRLLQRYYPQLDLKPSDILSAYVGIRPLVGAHHGKPGQAPVAGEAGAKNLQKVSREHSIELGPGDITLVGGGKYTTHRRMAEEIVSFTLKEWKTAAHEERAPAFPGSIIESRTDTPVNPHTNPADVARCRARAWQEGREVSARLLELFGTEAPEIHRLDAEARTLAKSLPADPPGFPALAGQLVHAVRTGCAMKLEDFYLRRAPLFLARADHGLPWAEGLATIWAHERGLPESEIAPEIARLQSELAAREIWRAT